jgi:hypothetical protein
MIRFLLLLAVMALSAGPALAQVKVKRCLSDAEIKTEQLVRHGVFLREAGTRCDEYSPGTAKLWQEFNVKVGDRFAQQTAKRRKMFEREFKDKAVEVMTYFDGRLVTYYRHYPLGIAYCGNIEKLLKDVSKKGWNAFAAQAETIQNEVRDDYKVCK